MTHLKSIPTFFFLMIILITFASCDKKEAIVEALNETEAVEIIVTGLQTYAGGLTSNLELLAEQLVTAVKSGELCDSLYSESINKTYSTLQVEASYDTELSYELTCNAVGIPKSATFSTSGDLLYETAKVISEDEMIFTGTASGLSLMEPSILIVGDFEKEGIQTLELMEQKTINSQFGVEVKSVELSKHDYEVESGTGVFSLTGTSNGEAFFYSGEIIFKGNKMATLSIEGTAYDVTWK